MVAGDSGKPLPKKLGLKDGQFVVFCDLPDELYDLRHAREFENVESIAPKDLVQFEERVDFIHMFAKERVVLERSSIT